MDFRGYRISARAVAQGARFAGFYRIERAGSDYSLSLPFRDEQGIEETYATPNEAIQAAYANAREAVLRELTRHAN